MTSLNLHRTHPRHCHHPLPHVTILGFYAKTYFKNSYWKPTQMRPLPVSHYWSLWPSNTILYVLQLFIQSSQQSSGNHNNYWHTPWCFRKLNLNLTIVRQHLAPKLIEKRDLRNFQSSIYIVGHFAPKKTQPLHSKTQTSFQLLTD